MTSDHIYHLSCHCQDHVLRLTLPSDKSVFEGIGVCDCSYCVKKRIVWGVAPPGSLTVVRGFGTDGKDLQGYEFGGKNCAHQFCPRCGSQLLGMKFDPSKDMYYNARNIRDDHFDLWDHPIALYSGIDRPPQYTHITLDDIPGAKSYMEERQKADPSLTTILVGSCHCQAIKVALASAPAEESEINDCACSICLGNGSLWIYPKRINTFWTPSTPKDPHQPDPESMVEYQFGTMTNSHHHCKQCGTNLYEGAPLSVRKERYKDPVKEGGMGLNVSMFSNINEYLEDIHGIGWEGEKRKEGHDGKYKTLDKLSRSKEAKTEEPLYKLNLAA